MLGSEWVFFHPFFVDMEVEIGARGDSVVYLFGIKALEVLLGSIGKCRSAGGKSNRHDEC